VSKTSWKKVFVGFENAVFGTEHFKYENSGEIDVLTHFLTEKQNPKICSLLVDNTSYFTELRVKIGHCIFRAGRRHFYRNVGNS